MIIKVMNESIRIICKAEEIKGRRPVYKNSWSLPKIITHLQSKGVPQFKIDILLEIYQTLRFGR